MKSASGKTTIKNQTIHVNMIGVEDSDNSELDAKSILKRGDLFVSTAVLYSTAGIVGNIISRKTANILPNTIFFFIIPIPPEYPLTQNKTSNTIYINLLCQILQNHGFLFQMEQNHFIGKRF